MQLAQCQLRAGDARGAAATFAAAVRYPPRATAYLASTLEQSPAGAEVKHLLGAAAT